MRGMKLPAPRARPKAVARVTTQRAKSRRLPAVVTRPAVALKTPVAVKKKMAAKKHVAPRNGGASKNRLAPKRAVVTFPAPAQRRVTSVPKAKANSPLARKARVRKMIVVKKGAPAVIGDR